MLPRRPLMLANYLIFNSYKTMNHQFEKDRTESQVPEAAVRRVSIVDSAPENLGRALAVIEQQARVEFQANAYKLYERRNPEYAARPATAIAMQGYQQAEVEAERQPHTALYERDEQPVRPEITIADPDQLQMAEIARANLQTIEYGQSPVLENVG